MLSMTLKKTEEEKSCPVKRQILEQILQQILDKTLKQILEYKSTENTTLATERW